LDVGYAGNGLARQLLDITCGEVKLLDRWQVECVDTTDASKATTHKSAVVCFVLLQYRWRKNKKIVYRLIWPTRPHEQIVKKTPFEETTAHTHPSTCHCRALGHFRHQQHILT